MKTFLFAIAPEAYIVTLAWGYASFNVALYVTLVCAIISMNVYAAVR